jgi:hypothetical protein
MPEGSKIPHKFPPNACVLVIEVEMFHTCKILVQPVALDFMGRGESGMNWKCCESEMELEQVELCAEKVQLRQSSLKLLVEA